MADGGEAAYQLLDAGNLPEVSVNQLEDPQDVQPQQVSCAGGTEHVGQLQQRCVGHHRERELLHEGGELDDGLTLLPHQAAAEACREGGGEGGVEGNHAACESSLLPRTRHQ